MPPARVMSKKTCRIASLNARSIFKDANGNIQKMFLSFLKSSSLSVDILCLQEVSAFRHSPHLTPEQCHKFTTYIFPNCSTVFTKHCAIICLNPSLYLDDAIVSSNERCISATVINSHTKSPVCSIINVYGPAQASERYSFLDYFMTLPFADQLTSDASTILLGDFNLQLAKLDNSCQNPSFRTWYDWINSNFVNSFPKGHPTFRRGSHHSTIDYIFYHASASNISNCVQTYVPSNYTDHQMLQIDLFQERDDIGPGSWQFNPTLLENPDYLLLLEELISSFMREKSSTTEPTSSSVMLWEASKKSLKITGESFSRGLKKRRKTTIAKLQQDYQAANSQTDTSGPQGDRLRQIASTLAQQLDEEIQMKCKETLLRSALRWHEQGERNNKYFFKVIRGRQHQQAIQALRSTTTGELVSSSSEILREIHTFYSDLYNPTSVDEDSIQHSNRGLFNTTADGNFK